MDKAVLAVLGQVDDAACRIDAGSLVIEPAHAVSGTGSTRPGASAGTSNTQR